MFFWAELIYSHSHLYANNLQGDHVREDYMQGCSRTRVVQGSTLVPFGCWGNAPALILKMMESSMNKFGIFNF
jgi:hypothetical protein